MRDLSFQIMPLIFHFALNVQLLGSSTGEILSQNSNCLWFVASLSLHILHYINSP